jgi:Uma2 family endonuclease
MNAPERKKPMTVDEFIPWAMAQPRGRFELVNGEPTPLSPERAEHRHIKAAVLMALHNAVSRSGIAAIVEPDGATVRIDEHQAFEPDALVYMGPRLPRDSVEVPEPIIVVEVVSPSTAGNDTGMKFAGYFSLPSVRHYLILDPRRRVVIQHSRGDDGVIASTSRTDGALVLDPPGIEVSVADMLPAD